MPSCNQKVGAGHKKETGAYNSVYECVNTHTNISCLYSLTEPRDNDTQAAIRIFSKQHSPLKVAEVLWGSDWSGLTGVGKMQDESGAIKKSKEKIEREGRKEREEGRKDGRKEKGRKRKEGREGRREGKKEERKKKREQKGRNGEMSEGHRSQPGKASYGQAGTI